jgi:ABC-type uncharacterized transport system permease subunit
VTDLALPSLLSGVSAMALLAYVVAALIPERAVGAFRVSLVVAWVLHALATVVDISGMGTEVAAARFGFATALSVTLWFVITVYLAEIRFIPISGLRRTLAILGAEAVLLALLFPGELRPHAGSPWAPIHWVLGIASYGLFGAAVLHATMLNRADRQMRQPPPAAPMTLPGNAHPRATLAAAPVGLPLMRLERLTFRFVSAGFVVLSLAIFLGWFFSDPWRWDHKAVFSILGWLVYAGLLTGRRRLGWRGRQATRWVYTGAVLLLLAYVGSRFVHEVLLSPPGA